MVIPLLANQDLTAMIMRTRIFTSMRYFHFRVKQAVKFFLVHVFCVSSTLVAKEAELPSENSRYFLTVTR